MAEIDDVANWCPKQVINWFHGLDDSLQHYIPNLEEAKVTGAQLLTLNYGDLENLGVSAIGHQVLILEAAELLKQLHYDVESENLQSRALDLNCRCRALRSHISTRGRADVNGTEAFRQGPSISLLKLACDVLDSSKLLVMWLDRPPFFSNNELRKSRADIVRLSYELSTTVQQPIFACTIEDAVVAICADMESLSNQIIASNDVMTIQPAFLEVTHLVNRDPSSGLGLFIKATFEGHHVITGTKEGSISSRIRRITPGDEVVAVGSRNVVGWQLAKLVAALKETRSDISITLKKRPQLASSSSTLTPLSRRNPKQGRDLTAPPIVQPIQKVVESRKNSIAGSIDSNLDKIGASKESLNSPKKETHKKKKLKKEKAKSSSNILAGSTERTKMLPDHRGSLSQEFTAVGHLRSASSSEAVLSSSTSNLTKNVHLRKSLEKIWRKEKLDGSTKNSRSSKAKSKQPKSENHAKMKKGKPEHKVVSVSMMPNNNDVLEELRIRRLKKSEARVIEANKFQSHIDHQRYSSEPSQQSSSPLDHLVIPPPPSAPYTPRVENVLQVLTDEEEPPPRYKKKSDKPSESPNSLLDIEHRRRFTIIGSEQMDERWYNSLMAEVNAKRAQWASSVTSKKVLERLDENATASEDSVFTSQSLVAEEIVVMKRVPKARGRNRPMSMPPNYYSAAKLNQYRIGQALGEKRQKGNSSKIPDGASPFGSNITPVAHQVDANGVKKLAPLNCSREDVNRSRSGENSLNSTGSRRVNVNNNNTSSSERKPYHTPPKPAPRNTPPATVNPKDLGRKSPHSKLADRGIMQRQSPQSNQTNVGRMKFSYSPTPDQVVPPYNAKPHSHVEPSHSHTQTAISNELGQLFAKQKVSRPSTSSDVFSPTGIFSPPWVKNDSSLPRSPAMGTGMVRIQSPSPFTPPVAKPRSRIVSVSDASKVALMPNQKQPAKHFPASNVRHGRIKSVDTSELLNTSTSHETQRRRSESTSTEKKFSEKDSLLGLAQAAPSSRGSYVAAIDGGYSLNDLLAAGANKSKGTENSDSHVIKVIDGVKVKLRKSPSISRSNSIGGKKGRLKIVDQLRASPEMKSHRRVSCRDLGAGECDGWLWKKKTNATSPLSSKWSKRWVVLKENALYCYHTEEDDKAESYIYLPGYKVTPALESKRRFAFRAAHPHRKTFYFASERQLDMTRWMNKLGLAAIEYSFSKTGNHTPKDENYFSESDSEEASNTSHSEGESANQTPNTSPEKPLKPRRDDATSTVTPSRNRAARHMSTQPDLNRSARYPKNKAELLKASATTQTTESLQRDTRDRSKSENHPVSASKDQESIVVPNSNGSNSPITSPRKKPAVSPENRKHKTDDTRRKQYRNSSHQPADLALIGVSPSHSEEELKHLKNVASKKAEEIAKRESLLSTTSLTSAQSGDSQNSTERTSMFGKAKKHKKDSAVISLNKDTVKAAVDAVDSIPGNPSDGQISPRAVRRDIMGRPKVKNESKVETEPVTKVEDGSMDDLCKALQNADVDIRGVSRKATLRRKVTILSRDPRKNDLMLRKRALQRQIKAREGELEYIKLLDDKIITSEIIHDWINQHQSFFSDLGTIRRLSKKSKNMSSAPQSEPTKEKHNTDTEATSSASTPTNTSKTMSVPPVPAKRTSLLLSESSHELPTQQVYSPSDQDKLSDSEVPPVYSPTKSIAVESRVRPRSWAVSASSGDGIRPRFSRSTSPHESPTHHLSSDSEKHYLETDL